MRDALFALPRFDPKELVDAEELRKYNNRKLKHRKTRRRNMHPAKVQYLRNWLFSDEHRYDPYPTEATKTAISLVIDEATQQITHWCVPAPQQAIMRRRQLTLQQR